MAETYRLEYPDGTTRLVHVPRHAFIRCENNGFAPDIGHTVTVLICDAGGVNRLGNTMKGSVIAAYAGVRAVYDVTEQPKEGG